MLDKNISTYRMEMLNAQVEQLDGIAVTDACGVATTLIGQMIGQIHRKLQCTNQQKKLKRKKNGVKGTP